MNFFGKSVTILLLFAVSSTFFSELFVGVEKWTCRNG